MNSRRALVALALAPFVINFDLGATNAAFPTLENDLADVSRSGLSWFFTAYSVVFAALLVSAGRVADDVGRRWLFMAGMWMFLAGAAGCALAGGVTVMIVARVAQAVGAALLVPTSMALMLAALPPEQRGRATGAWTTAGAAGAGVGFLAGGYLAGELGWRLVLAAEVPLVLLSLMVIGRKSGETQATEPGPRPDALGIVLLAIGMAGCTLATVQLPTWGPRHPATLIALGGGLVALATFARRSIGHRAPALELSLFRLRSFAAGNVAMLFLGGSFYAFQLTCVLCLTGAWGLTPLEAGAASAPGPLVAMVGATLGGRACERFGASRAAAAGLLIIALGAGLLAAVVGHRADLVTFVLAVAITNIGIGASLAATMAAAITDMPPGAHGTGVGTVWSFRQLGGAIGVAMLLAGLHAGAALGDVGPYRVSWVIIACAAGVGAVAALFAGPPPAALRLRPPKGSARPARS